MRPGYVAGSGDLDECNGLTLRGDNRLQMTKNILIVDDTPANLRLLAEMLTKRGYKIRPAPNGHRALATVQKELPDLILLDIMMPKMDGYEVCRRLKADELTKDIPIIFISALNEVFDKMTAFSIGGVDYITKPFQMEEVLARVHTHLSLQDMRQSLQEKNEQLQQQNAELDTFAHTVAHDLKSPLSQVITSLDILKEYASPVLDEDMLEMLKIGLKTGHKMVNIIDELLLLASFRRGEVKTRPLDMNEIITQVQHRLFYMTESYKAEIIKPNSWPIAEGYAPWIEEVWANYLSNALKYGGQPPRLELGATPQADNTIRFWIRDNGQGLSPTEQSALFTEFIRFNKMRIQGHGLGLSIVRRIMDKLGGQVGVESKVGQGSEFYFILPASSPASSE